MARQRKAIRTKDHRLTEALAPWRTLEWEDLERWTDSRTLARGRGYQRNRHVSELAIADDGRMLASVQGERRYATSVTVTIGKQGRPKLASACTCPVGESGCKHAVAAVLQLLADLAEGKTIAAATKQDLRWARIARSGDDDGYDDDELDEDVLDDDNDDDVDDGGAGAPAVSKRKSPSPSRDSRAKSRPTARRSRAQWDEAIRAHLASKRREELLEYLWSLVERLPDLRNDLEAQVALAEGNVAHVVRDARRELGIITAEPEWNDRRGRRSETPDHAKFRRQLAQLVAMGHADAAVELGTEFIDEATRTIEEMGHDAMDAMEVESTAEVVFAAVAKATWPPPKKILYAIDAVLDDGVALLGSPAAKVLDAKWPASEWSTVADALKARIGPSVTDGDAGRGSGNVSSAASMREYRRSQLGRWWIRALERAGRHHELLAAYESEACSTMEYEPLVAFLIDTDRFDDARRWATEGIAATESQWPGIAARLRDLLGSVAKRCADHPYVAALAARKFFEHPNVESFRALIAAAHEAGCGERVEVAARGFLETGRVPNRATVDRKGVWKLAVDSAWPLPMTDELMPAARPHTFAAHGPQPRFDVLLDLAIADGKPDEIIHWYETITARDGRSPLGGANHRAPEPPASALAVADALGSTHPQRAIEIYRQVLDRSVEHSHVSNYQRATVCLRKMRPLLATLGREGEWTRLVEQVRAENRNRPRFMEMLETVEGGRIVEKGKPRRDGAGRSDSRRFDGRREAGDPGAHRDSHR